jgi:hypothetical protein
VDGTSKLYLDEFVRVCHHRALLGAARLRLGEEGLEALGGDVRHRVAGEVAHDHGRPGILLAPPGYELIRQAAGLPAAGKNAGIQLEQGLVHCHLLSVG